MKRYRNEKTGLVIEVENCTVSGNGWVDETPPSRPKKARSTKKAVKTDGDDIRDGE